MKDFTLKTILLEDSGNDLQLPSWSRGSEFSSYKIELQNRVTQNDVTLRVTNLKFYRRTSFEVLTRVFKILHKLRATNLKV